MSNTHIPNHVEPVLDHRLADSIEVEFCRPNSHRLQPQSVNGLEGRELQLLRAEREENCELRVADQPDIEQLSTRNSQVSQ